MARYRQQLSQGGDVAEDEALAVFRLVGRRPDAALVYADAGRRAARYAAGGSGRVRGMIWRCRGAPE